MTEEHLQKIWCIQEKMICALKQEVDKNMEHLDTHEAYEVVDIIKDLAETERNYYEAWYYKTVTDAMHNKETFEDHEKAMKEIWKSSDMDKRRKMQASVQAMLNDMGA